MVSVKRGWGALVYELPTTRYLLIWSTGYHIDRDSLTEVTFKNKYLGT